MKTCKSGSASTRVRTRRTRSMSCPCVRACLCQIYMSYVMSLSDLYVHVCYESPEHRGDSLLHSNFPRDWYTGLGHENVEKFRRHGSSDASRRMRAIESLPDAWQPLVQAFLARSSSRSQRTAECIQPQDQPVNAYRHKQRHIDMGPMGHHNRAPTGWCQGTKRARSSERELV